MVLVRERRRKLGLPIAEGGRSFSECRRPPNQPKPEVLDVAPIDSRQHQQWHGWLAHRRMLEPFDAWQQALALGKPARETATLEAKYRQEAILSTKAAAFLEFDIQSKA